jgi:DNA polymerase III epsilon subunit-like protein
MSQPMPDRETIAKILNIITPYVSLQHDNILGALLASDLDLAPIREAVKGQAHAGNAALIALVEHALAKQIDFVHPNWTEQTIIQIEKRVSQSNNITWKCDLLNRAQPLYIRQSNKALFLEHYPDIEGMALNFPYKAEIKVYTSPDGDFLKLEKVCPGGLLSYRRVTASSEADKRKASARQKLANFYPAVYVDFETSGIGNNAEIVQYGIATVDYGAFDTLHSYIKPQEPELLSIPGKNGKSAQDIHGIKAERLAGEEPFPMHYESLKALLEGKTVVTYGDFDLRILNQVCERHSLPAIQPSRHINLMTIYAEYHGEEGFVPGDYKWQTLEKAIEQVKGKPLVGAHDALVDALAMREIVTHILAEDSEAKE